MSSALAIAAVTYVLKDLLNNGVIDKNLSGQTGGNINVSALPPPDPGTVTSGDQLNLYMYRVTFNQGWKNAEFPSFDNQGSRMSNPPLALNLHYLLTAYGTDELHTEILLGYGVQFLHESPVLDRKAIRGSLADSKSVSGNGLPEKYKALSLSGLAEQIEQIKIIPENLSTEEISKLWTAFGAKYRPTAAYQVSVVLIESNKSTKNALRVKQPMIDVGIFNPFNPLNQPIIEKIRSQVLKEDKVVENDQIFAGSNLVIYGRQLKGEIVKVNISGKELTPIEKNITDSQIIIPLPEDLRAGVQSVQVYYDKAKSSHPGENYRTVSNLASFVLIPLIVKPVKVSNLIVIPNNQISGIELRSADLTLSVKPVVSDTQRVVLLLNEVPKEDAKEPSMSYSFEDPVIAAALQSELQNDITFHVSGVKAGDYLARILVDGAESPLECDDTGNYNSPKVPLS